MKLRQNIKQEYAKQDGFTKTIYWVTVVLLLLSVVSIVLGRGDDDDMSRHIFNAMSCLLMLAAMSLPFMITKFFKVRVPTTMQIVFVLFAFCGIVLGDVFNLFDKIKHWDTMLHFSSGMLIAILGFILVNTLNRADSVQLRLSPIYVAASVFCFALAVGALWEVVEYLMDDWFNMTMQTYMETSGGSIATATDVPLMGHEALKDTMWDLMLDAGGAAIIAVLGYLQIKSDNRKGFAFEHLEDAEEDTAAVK